MLTSDSRGDLDTCHSFPPLCNFWEAELRIPLIFLSRQLLLHFPSHPLGLTSWLQMWLRWTVLYCLQFMQERRSFCSGKYLMLCAVRLLWCHNMGASPKAQVVKNLPAMQEMWVWFLSWEDSLEKEMATQLFFLTGESHGQRRLVGYGP